MLVVCALPEKTAPYYGERGTARYIFQDTAAATENLLLSAAMHGLSTNWVGAFDDEKISAALELDATMIPVALVALGYPKKVPEKPARDSVADVTTYID